MLSTKKIFLLIFLLLLGGLSLFNIPKAYAQTFEEQVVSLINQERAKQNLSAYNYSSKLFDASLKHNTTMFNCAKTYGVNSCFKHQVTLLSEQTLMERVKATGYNPQAVAENIAWGYTSPKSVVSAWMGSSGHRANILGSYRDIGCDYLNALNGSYQGMYWTCDFGRSFSSSTTPTPTLTPTKTPTATPTRSQSSPTPTKTPTATPTNVPNSTPTPTSIIPTPSEKPWWCSYIPTHTFCN